MESQYGHMGLIYMPIAQKDLDRGVDLAVWQNMTDFLTKLPAPRSGGLTVADSTLAAYTMPGAQSRLQKSQKAPAREIPPYLHRQGFIPRCEEDFGGGGAYPEIFVAQYPLGMGKESDNASSGSTLSLQVGPDGRLAYDLVVRHGSKKTVVYTRPESAHGLQMQGPEAALEAAMARERPGKEEEEKELQRTKQAIEKELEKKSNAGRAQPQQREAEFVRYTPAKLVEGHNSGCAQRLLRLEDVAVDPLDPPRFKHKRVPAARFSPPPPVLHSPTRKLTLQDQQDWKIPPCVSNWKNQKGYTIPLDKRVAADGRNLQDVSVNDKFASLSEALYIAERQAREEIRLRNEVKKQKKIREEELREQQLRQLAAQARAERAQLLQQSRRAAAGDAEEEAERQQREQIAREREKDIERAVRLERSRGKRRDDSQRDISELVALGLPVDAKKQRTDSMFDTRLFNQGGGTDSGYKGGEDDTDTLYDRPLFAQRGGAGIYQFSRDRFSTSVGEGSELAAFAGADKTRYMRTGPVEFEKDVSDPFGLDNLLSEAHKK
ncbi:GAMYB-binding protein, related [Eimeria necatrix]|uniref:GAMYB-binding protein, related n=1 Tax=Eimeria necatrix TaxID=51315 RepID=U6MXZ7_9EIME|nr:GAMYB-binding protein, related [Eimeria necatrix]CDJ67394.1 GAMYB-binding protein, related [Eimeria necatrix]